MAKTLIIAEKPSVAADIARALGGFTRHDDYFESDRQILSSAVGHLLEIGMPEEEEVKRGKWTFAHLPAVPSKFALKPIEKNENRLKTLLKLIKRKDVTALINACDAGREGELIFRYIAQYAKTSKPIKRLWLQSMTPAAIRDGFAQLRSDEAMLPLADAAVCRSEADWLVGINGTRAMTAFNSKSGGFQLTTVGRVQTPTLAILVEREEKIRAFRPRDYWEVVGTFRALGGEYTGRWFDEKFKRAEDDPDSRAERVWNEAQARAIADKCAGKPGTVSEESKPSTQSPPLLYDLTSLQREANGRFGFSARTTLSLAQALYEKHKVLTYPRTDARALPEDYIDTVKATLRGIGRDQRLRRVRARNPEAEVGAAEQADLRQLEDLRSLRDHPDAVAAEASERDRDEALRPRRAALPRGVLSAGRAPADHAHHARRGRAVQDRRASILVSPGWLAVYGKEAQGEEASLVPVQPNEKVATEKVDVVPLVTKPPPRLNEATLLSAMEGAGKLIEDDDLREAMREKGLGTPATRAAIIEGLICGTLRPSRRQGAHADRQGVLADDAAARSRRARAVLAGAHRGVGVQARADGAREASRATPSCARSSR